METEEVVSRRERFSPNTPPKNSGKVWTWVLIILVIIAIVGGVFFFMSQKKTEDTSSSITPTSAVPTEAPTPTEEEVANDKYNLQVLNGTETAGEAGKLKTALEKEGYKVIATGNADKQTYTKTIIQSKAKVEKGFVNKLRTELEKTYPVGTDEELEDSNENDVVIIIGMEPTAETPTASVTKADEKDSATPTTTPTSSPSPTPTP